MASSAVGLASLAGCHPDMWRQAKVQPLAQSEFFVDKQGARPLVANTVARNPFGKPVPADAVLRTDNPLYTGMENGKLVTTIPAAAYQYFDNDRRKMLKRGQERFNIFCSPCHSRLGDGNGMIARRGLNLRKKPASYHTDRLRNLPDGHFFNVITNGLGIMYSYASRVDPEDRWAIVAYIRVLQLSQNATVSDVPADKVPELDKPAEAAKPMESGAPKE